MPDPSIPKEAFGCWGQLPIYRASSRFACLLAQHLPCQVEGLLRPELATHALVIIRKWDERVLDAHPLAEQAGISHGDSRRRVEQLYPQAYILEAREELYSSYNDALHAALREFAKRVELHGLGGFFIEIGQLARTFPSEKALALEIVAQTAQAARLDVAVGIASNKFTAETAAHHAATESNRVVTVPSNKERDYLAPLPVQALPNPPLELIQRLQVFGITTLGGFAEIPSPAASAQFGPDLKIFHDLARGLDPRPLIPYAPPPTITKPLTFTNPISDRGLLLVALERAANRVAADLSLDGYYTAALSMIVLDEKGAEHKSGTTINPPSSDAALLRRATARILNHLTLKRAAIGVTLTAYPLQDQYKEAQQLLLPTLEEQLTPAQIRYNQFLEILKRIRQRFGETIIRIASSLGPPLPLPIKVQVRNEVPGTLHWGGWNRIVTHIRDSYFQSANRWDSEALITRTYWQLEINGQSELTIFRDRAGRWFLDRRRSSTS